MRTTNRVPDIYIEFVAFILQAILIVALFLLGSWQLGLAWVGGMIFRTLVDLIKELI